MHTWFTHLRSCWLLQGIGPKTAKQLVQNFGTVEQIAHQLPALPEEQLKKVRHTLQLLVQPYEGLLHITGHASTNALVWFRLACPSQPAVLHVCLACCDILMLWYTDAQLQTLGGAHQSACCGPWLLSWQVVKLNKSQRAILLSEDGQVAAAFMKELVTINTKLKAPPCQ